MPILKLHEVGKPRPPKKPLQRLTAHQRGYTHEWNEYSKQYRREYPVCAHCVCNPTEMTDHIVPHNGPKDPLFWDPTNHQPLCHGCHSKKTAKEDGGFGNRGIVKRVKQPKKRA